MLQTPRADAGSAGCRCARRSRRSGSTRPRPRCPGSTMLSRSCAPSPMRAPSPSTTGPIRRTPRRSSRRGRSTPALRPRCPRGSAAPPATITPGQTSSPSTSRRSSPRSASKVPWRSSASEPTSFQYSRDLVDVEGHVVLEQRREHVLGPVDERPLGEVVEDLRVEHVDAAVAEVRERLLGARLLLEARDPALAVVQHDAVLARVGDLLDGQRRDPAGLAVPRDERRRGRCR